MGEEQKKKTPAMGSGKSAFRCFFEFHEYTKHCFMSGHSPSQVCMVVFDSLHTVWSMYEPEKAFGRDLPNRIVSDIYDGFNRGAQNVTICFDKGASIAKGATQQQRHQQRHGLTKETKAALEAMKVIDEAMLQQVMHTRTPLEQLPKDASKEQKKAAKTELARIIKVGGNEGAVMKARHNQYLAHKYQESIRRSELQVQAYRSEVGISCFADHRALVRLEPFLDALDDKERAACAVRHVMGLPLPRDWSLFCATNRTALVRFVVQSLLMNVIVPPSKEIVIDGHCCDTEDVRPSWNSWTKHTDRDTQDISEVPLVVEPKSGALCQLLNDPRPMELLKILSTKHNSTAITETCETGFAPNEMRPDERLRNSCGEADFAVFYHIIRFLKDRILQNNILHLLPIFHIYSRDTDVLLYALLFLFRLRRGWFGEDIRLFDIQLYVTYKHNSMDHRYVDVNMLYQAIADRFFAGDDRYVADLVCVSFATKSDYTSGYDGVPMQTKLVTYLTKHKVIGHLVRPVKNTTAMRLQALPYRRLVAMAYCTVFQRYKCYFTDANPRYAELLLAVGQSRADVEIHSNLELVRDIVQEVKLKSLKGPRNARKRELILKYMDDERTNPSDSDEFEMLCGFLDSLVANDDAVETNALQLLWYFNFADQVGQGHMHELPYEQYGYYMVDPDMGWVKSNVHPKSTSQADIRSVHRIRCYATDLQ